MIEAVGKDVETNYIGQVYGMNDWFADGATAEYCTSVPRAFSSKPTQLTHFEAASVPIGALTAWQGLYDRAKLGPGQRVLIHGGSGTVGMFAVQLAQRVGAHVITTASPRNFEFLEKLGADEVLDITTNALQPDKASSMWSLTPSAAQL